MGVPGLLVGLKAFVVKSTVQSYAHQSLAIDLSGWLHKSVYSIADHFVEEQEQIKKEKPRGAARDRAAGGHSTKGGGRHDNKNTSDKNEDASSSTTSRSLNVSSSYVIQRCHELLRFARVAKIYLVLDGKRCPMKTVTNDERERRRHENLKQARYHRDRGEHDKAFEKYKACIKVPSDVADAVADKVRHAFRDDPRVEVVHSPYEADAQLVQLVLDHKVHAVVTEDSDVLVYQAACHVHFPIIFKLDRNSGACDVLSMEWLLSPGTKTSAPWNRQNDGPDAKVSLFDAVLKTLADRELRDPGLGARLFVQSCVLTGCDYSPNVLSGVGLVNAFKLVRNSVHRSNSDRFRHALQQLPPKAKQSVGDKIEYEELLAKSEAVFYHHMVCQHDGSLAFLGDHVAIPSHGHKPEMDRFGGDWSFLGDVSCDENGRVLPGPLRDVDDASTKPASLHDTSAPPLKRGATSQPALVKNPYQNARKRPRHPPLSPDRKPLAPVKENSARSPQIANAPHPFSKFLCKPGPPSKEETDPVPSKFKVYTGDPRFVNPTSFDDIWRCANRRGSDRRDTEGASSSQRGSSLASKGSDHIDRRLPPTEAHDIPTAQPTRPSVPSHNSQNPGMAVANAFLYDGSSSRHSRTTFSHESIASSERLSRDNASQVETVARPMDDNRQFSGGHFEEDSEHVRSYLDETDDDVIIVDPPAMHTETAPMHTSVNSTDGIYANLPPEPPPTPPRDARPFQYYDHDFMCSPDPANYAMSNEQLLVDDIADESPSPARRSLPAQAMDPSTGLASRTSRFFNQKPQSTLGPAKTIRPSLHHVKQTQTGGLKRFQNRGLQKQPPLPRACATQRHQPPPSSGRGTKRARSSGEKQHRSILDFMKRR